MTAHNIAQRARSVNGDFVSERLINVCHTLRRGLAKPYALVILCAQIQFVPQEELAYGNRKIKDAQECDQKRRAD